MYSIYILRDVAEIVHVHYNITPGRSQRSYCNRVCVLLSIKGFELVREISVKLRCVLSDL